MTTEVELKKGKKKSGKSKDVGAEPVADGVAEVKEGKKEKKRKRKEDEAAPVDEDGEAEGSTQPVEAAEKKAKKEKKPKASTSSAVAVEEASASASTLPSSSDIVADTTLSSGAQQALIYARQHALHSSSPANQKSDPPIWKFNKAKQNWLLKHLWDVNELPSKYTDLVFGYVATVQGGRRRDVQDKAQELSLRPTSKPVEEEVEGEKEVEGASEDAEEVKRRAVRVLELLQAQL